MTQFKQSLQTRLFILCFYVKKTWPIYYDLTSCNLFGSDYYQNWLNPEKGLTDELIDSQTAPYFTLLGKFPIFSPLSMMLFKAKKHWILSFDTYWKSKN